MWTTYESNRINSDIDYSDLEFLLDRDPLSFVNQVRPEKTTTNPEKTTSSESASWFKPEVYDNFTLTSTTTQQPVQNTNTTSTTTNKNRTADTIIQYLKNNYGFTDASAKAFAGQVYRENGFRINAINEDEKDNKNSAAISQNGGYGAGLIQFTGDLKRKAEELLGKKVENASLQEQLSILEPLYLERNPTVWNELKTTNNLDRALDLAYAGLVAGGYSADKITDETRRKLVNKYKLTHQRLGYKNIYDTWQRAADWAKNYKTS